MKVYITDNRNNPRILFIDGKRYILPSRKEILKDISKSSLDFLSTLPFIKIRPYEDPKPVEELKQVESFKGEIEEVNEESKPVEELTNSTEVLHESVIVQQEELVEPVVEQEPVVDYNSMSKKELRVLLEEKGVDTTGMSKANMLEKLKEID